MQKLHMNNGSQPTKPTTPRMQMLVRTRILEGGDTIIA